MPACSVVAACSLHGPQSSANMHGGGSSLRTCLNQCPCQCISDHQGGQPLGHPAAYLRARLPAGGKLNVRVQSRRAKPVCCIVVAPPCIDIDHHHFYALIDHHLFYLQIASVMHHHLSSARGRRTAANIINESSRTTLSLVAPILSPPTLPRPACDRVIFVSPQRLSPCRARSRTLLPALAASARAHAR